MDNREERLESVKDRTRDFDRVYEISLQMFGAVKIESD